jgi:hypothetical protein
LIDPSREEIPGLASVRPSSVAIDSNDRRKINPAADRVPVVGLASPTEATAFNVWLRRQWEAKEQLLNGFVKTGAFEHTGVPVEGGSVVMPIAF